jgi:cystathionine beta-lyase/cystathionine gamma-synthase
MGILRKNLLNNKRTKIFYIDKLPKFIDFELLKYIYGYKFDCKKIEKIEDIYEFEGSSIFISQNDELAKIYLKSEIDFFLNMQSKFGSILLVNGYENEGYISEIQHVRRRETIAMTPNNCFSNLNSILNNSKNIRNNTESNKKNVSKSIAVVSGTNTKSVVGSSGLSIQYAIMMGLIHDAIENHKGKSIKFIVPPNCYGGTNDQARRVCQSIDNVEVMDLLVDRGNDMVSSIDLLLNKIAKEDAVPYIIAEIPTNPRVEVPNLMQLKEVLSQERRTGSGEIAIEPVFILDQTFCPNIPFLAKGEILSKIRTISYVSGSKFPSGGKCTAGYCVGNTKTEGLMDKIELHLKLCDNEATSLQYEILAKQIPSMNQRIKDAYKNTHDFVNFINNSLPQSKINFVSEELAQQGFTPSVFSLDLPSKGASFKEKEKYKRKLNHTLINLMITEIPNESKYCVSYGQLKGCYWTIPATSTQGTTKEGDKDYIVRVALSANMDLEHHKKVFLEFVKAI